MNRNDRLLASKQAATAAKEAFQASYKRALADCAVGLGLNRDGEDWALKVYAKSSEAEARLPHSFRFGSYEVDVDVEVMGGVSAF